MTWQGPEWPHRKPLDAGAAAATEAALSPPATHRAWATRTADTVVEIGIWPACAGAQIVDELTAKTTRSGDVPAVATAALKRAGWKVAGGWTREATGDYWAPVAR